MTKNRFEEYFAMAGSDVWVIIDTEISDRKSDIIKENWVRNKSGEILCFSDYEKCKEETEIMNKNHILSKDG